MVKAKPKAKPRNSRAKFEVRISSKPRKTAALIRLPSIRVGGPTRGRIINLALSNGKVVVVKPKTDARLIAELRERLGVPEEREPRRKLAPVVPPPEKRVSIPKVDSADLGPSWERAKSYVGSWSALAKAMHVSAGKLRAWRSNPDAVAVARLKQFLEAQERQYRVSQKEVREFNALLARARQEEFFPDYRTTAGKKEGAHTVGRYYTKNFNRMASESLRGEIINWVSGLRAVSGYNLWHATGLILQYGGTGPRLAYNLESLVKVVPQKMAPEAADFTRGYIEGVPATTSRQTLLDLLDESLELLEGEHVLTLVVWISVRNYRKKTAKEISEWWQMKNREYQSKKKLQEKKATN